MAESICIRCNLAIGYENNFKITNEWGYSHSDCYWDLLECDTGQQHGPELPCPNCDNGKAHGYSFQICDCPAGDALIDELFMADCGDNAALAAEYITRYTTQECSCQNGLVYDDFTGEAYPCHCDAGDRQDKAEQFEREYFKARAVYYKGRLSHFENVYA